MIQAKDSHEEPLLINPNAVVAIECEEIDGNYKVWLTNGDTCLVDETGKTAIEQALA